MAFPNGPAGAPHEFADPETAGHADIERDNNEVHRRIVFLTLLDPAHADRPGLGVTLNNNIAHVQNVANRVRERENAVNAPRPLTEIPVAGGAHNLNGVRSQHICKFTGTSKKPEDLYSWLGQVMQCAVPSSYIQHTAQTRTNPWVVMRRGGTWICVPRNPSARARRSLCRAGGTRSCAPHARPHTPRRPDAARKAHRPRGPCALA